MSGNIQIPREPGIPATVARKGAIPVVLLAALTSPLAYTTLERWEGNVWEVYRDNLTGGLPTYCAGRTDRSAVVGTKLTDDQCREVNKATLLEYGYAVLGCVNWDYLTVKRLIGLTMFAINVGKAGACGSQSVLAINAGDIDRGCNLIARRPSGAPNWSTAGGKYVQGLQNRRMAERELCLAVEPVAPVPAETPLQPAPDAVPVPWCRLVLAWFVFWK